MEEEFETAIPVAEMLIAKRDCELVKKLMLNMNPALSSGSIQYMSLFCAEIVIYISKKVGEIAVENYSPYSMKDIRNKAKFFSDSTKKTLLTVANADYLQNEEFVNYLRFPSLGRWNLHDNLGIYLDEDGKIVGNTQMAYYLFKGEKSMTQSISAGEKGSRIRGEEAREYGIALGKIIGAVSEGFSSLNDFVSGEVLMAQQKVYYKDFNTNRISFPSGKKANLKVVYLFLLHLISNINVCLFVLKKSIARDSGWLLRVEYIAYYYGIIRLKELKEYILAANDEQLITTFIPVIDNIVSNVGGYINSVFRSCMMHYSFINPKSDNVEIDERYLNLALPLCGLVESCFNEMTYFELQTSIEKELLFISESLTSFLNLDLRNPNLMD